jgi:microcystin-dependent protein
LRKQNGVVQVLLLYCREGSTSKIISPNTDFFKVGSDSPVPISSQFVPIGTILPFAGEKIPEGYLLCDGKEYDRVLHKPLFDVIGTLWGQNLPTHFKVPDLRGQFLRGVDENRKLNSPQNYSTALPKVKFIIGEGAHSHELITGGSATIWPDGGATSNYDRRYFTLNATERGGRYKVENTDKALQGDTHEHVITGGDNETRPKNVAVNYIIKAK